MKNKVFCIIMLKTLLKIWVFDHIKNQIRYYPEARSALPPAPLEILEAGGCRRRLEEVCGGGWRKHEGDGGGFSLNFGSVGGGRRGERS